VYQLFHQIHSKQVTLLSYTIMCLFVQKFAEVSYVSVEPGCKSISFLLCVGDRRIGREKKKKKPPSEVFNLFPYFRQQRQNGEFTGS
jgi:hypothetical protein